MKHFILIFSIMAAACFATAQTPATLPVKPELVLVQGGTFTMGSNAADARSHEKPTHSVTVSTFSIGKYEVTWAQYKAFCTAAGRPLPSAPEWGINDKHPVVNVNYNDCVAYCNWLGETYGGDWRLPTEAEWEYAARGGNKSLGYTYSGGNDMDQLGWYEDNAAGQTMAVGRKKPNELGLCDMSGNVWEWCKDWYEEGYYAASPANNPKGPTSGSYRVIRGGGWGSSAAGCRVACRTISDPTFRYSRYGFRVVLSQ